MSLRAAGEHPGECLTFLSGTPLAGQRSRRELLCCKQVTKLLGGEADTDRLLLQPSLAARSQGQIVVPNLPCRAVLGAGSSGHSDGLQWNSEDPPLQHCKAQSPPCHWASALNLIAEGCGIVQRVRGGMAKPEWCGGGSARSPYRGTASIPDSIASQVNSN